MHSTEIFPHTVTIGEVDSTKIEYWNFCLKLHREKHTGIRALTAPSYNLTAKQTLTSSKKPIEFTYGDFPCHLKLNRADKVALINCLWKGKKGERLKRSTRWIPPAVAVRTRKIPPALGTNQITGFDEFRPVTSWKKIKDHMVQKLFQVNHITFQSCCWYGGKISLFPPEIPSEDV